MKKDIENYNKQGNLHGVQIHYLLNGNIRWIRNYYHGLWHGYRVSFNLDNSIFNKQYWNMDKVLYIEDHEWSKQIQIKI